jgi:hypothetical protein
MDSIFSERNKFGRIDPYRISPVDQGVGANKVKALGCDASVSLCIEQSSNTYTIAKMAEDRK